ncbi:HipA N-terminal domain-containing protein [Gelidibacter maritimus]|uniref:HipA N-terminal domain-containing protein n=1 Tax=Gelidibacter maritimus TaxID=2761487 RepID=A0A7W2R3Y0_9FLAO|nr:HipA N-terminal domain-containing protein [Gelidibacter maritimus]MBA6153133.1 HipA N-terminal domain-containing protein [Gelidibacter maritimus]
MLSILHAKDKKAFSFVSNNDWLKSKKQLVLDSDIQFYSGPQYPSNKESFGVFLDSMPDTWGRTMLKRKQAQLVSERDERARTLYDIDY